ncbi:MAG: hypothetical protein ACLTSX_14245 [Collinsella sp.]
MLEQVRERRARRHPRGRPHRRQPGRVRRRRRVRLRMSEIDELLDIILARDGHPAGAACRRLSPWMSTTASSTRMVAGGPRVAPFLHLPLQSGCSCHARAHEPSLHRGAIRGHGRPHPHQAPERLHLVRHHRRLSRRDGRRSLPRACLCERVGFSRMHVFRYSAPARARPAADGALARWPPEVMAARAERAARTWPSAAPRPTRAARVGSCRERPCWSTATAARSVASTA